MAKTAAWQRSEGKICSSCLTLKSIDGFYRNGFRVNGLPKFNSWCKECRLEKVKTKYREDTQYAKSIIKVRSKSPRSYLSYLLSKAKQRKKEVEINLDYLENLWNEQNGKCALTNDYMTYSVGDINSVSIDRIDSSKGYIEGNVQLVKKKVNIAKSDMTTEEFFNMCKKVYENGI